MKRNGALMPNVQFRHYASGTGHTTIEAWLMGKERGCPQVYDKTYTTYSITN